LCNGAALINRKEQFLPSEADTHSGSLEIPCLYGTPVHRSPSLVSVLSRFNPVHMPKSSHLTLTLKAVCYVSRSYDTNVVHKTRDLNICAMLLEDYLKYKTRIKLNKNLKTLV
jgi:hypothetical protein